MVRVANLKSRLLTICVMCFKHLIQHYGSRSFAFNVVFGKLI